MSGRHVLSERTSQPKPVLIVSTNVDFLLCFKHILEVDRFSVALAQSAAECVETTVRSPVDALVLDCVNGSSFAADICVPLKSRPDVSAIHIVAIIEEGASSLYLDMVKAGADRCFHRPFEPIKLLEYLRTHAADAQHTGDLRIVRGTGIEIEADARRARRNGITLNLGAIEFRLLELLVTDPGRAFSRKELIEAGWQGQSGVLGRTVDVHVALLRKALRQEDASEVIRTVRGVGYALNLKH